MSDVVTVPVGGEQTNGVHAVFESITPPDEGVPLLHTHPHQETFHVLEGILQIFGRDDSGDKTATLAPAGSTVRILGGAPHGYLNVGDTGGRLLMIDEPATIEDFFRDLGTPLDAGGSDPSSSGPPDMERVLAICARHGIHFVEAPPQ